jgi:hypothetical protein
MTPLLNQLSLYQSAQSFQNPDGDYTALTKAFYRRIFGAEAEILADTLPLFEIIPDWGNYLKIDMPRGEYHLNMRRSADLLKSLKGNVNEDVPFNPGVEVYRESLEFFFELFSDLSGDTPDYDALQKRYWSRVYAIYDQLPKHVDPRPYGATERLIRFFDPKRDRSGLGALPGRWTS